MSTVLSSKKVIVIGVVIFIALVMQTESFAGEDWEVRTQLPPKRLAFATAVVGHKIYLIGGSVYDTAETTSKTLKTVYSSLNLTMVKSTIIVDFIVNSL